jgi:hypothetical protein
MSKLKLSAKQKEVIQRLRNGDAVHYLNGINARCFYSGGANPNISWATIGKLEDLNLTTRTEKRVILTELGKSIDLNNPD